MGQKEIDLIREHIQDKASGCGTFMHEGQEVYEYILSDWNKQGEVKIVWNKGEPITAETTGEHTLCCLAASMLDLEEGRKVLAKLAKDNWK